MDGRVWADGMVWMDGGKTDEGAWIGGKARALGRGRGQASTWAERGNIQLLVREWVRQRGDALRRCRSVAGAPPFA